MTRLKMYSTKTIAIRVSETSHRQQLFGVSPRTLRLASARIRSFVLDVYDSIRNVQVATLTTPEGFCIPTVMHYSTGNKPPTAAPAKELFSFGHVRGFTLEEAQREVKRMLDDPCAVHEYLTYEACNLTGNKEVAQYTVNIMLGALGEDFEFYSGEGLEDILIEKGGAYHRNVIRRGRDAFYYEDVPNFLTGLFKVVARLFKKTKERDPINRPYMAHFYKPQKDGKNKGLYLWPIEAQFQDAKSRLCFYFEEARKEYAAGRIGIAFYELGHALHLLQDMHVPAHDYNDPHGLSRLLGKLDSLEVWMVQINHDDIRRGKGKPNVRIWDSRPLAPPEIGENWLLDTFVERVVKNTQRYRSVDVKGTDSDQQKIGALSDEECFSQGEVLIPAAISDSAELILAFLNQVRRKVSGVRA